MLSLVCCGNILSRNVCGKGFQNIKTVSVIIQPVSWLYFIAPYSAHKRARASIVWLRTPTWLFFYKKKPFPADAMVQYLSFSFPLWLIIYIKKQNKTKNKAKWIKCSVDNFKCLQHGLDTSKLAFCIDSLETEKQMENVLYLGNLEQNNELASAFCWERFASFNDKTHLSCFNSI